MTDREVHLHYRGVAHPSKITERTLYIMYITQVPRREGISMERSVLSIGYNELYISGRRILS